MAYVATITNPWVRGETTEVDIVLTDPAGVRPDVRESRVYRTSQVNAAFLIAERAALIAITVARQNQAARLGARGQDSLAQAAVVPQLDTPRDNLLDALAVVVANSMATPATKPWTDAKAAALVELQRGFRGLMNMAVAAANEAVG